MKRVIFLLLTIVILTVDAGAFDLPEELEDALPETAEVFMKHADLSGVDGFVQSLGGMAGQVGAQLSGIVRQRMKGAASILLVVILCGLTEGILAGTGNKQSFFSLAGALTISLLTARSLDQLIGLGADTIRELTLFSKTLLPTMAAATATSGALVTATVQQAMTLFLVDVLLNLISTCLLPLVYLYIGVLTASCCLQDGRIGLVAETLRKGLVWVLTTVLIGFTVYLSMVHIVSGAADGSKVRLAKSAISGMVPVVGKVVADAAETVLDSVTADYRTLFEEKKQIMPPTLFPGVVEMLDTLHGMGITCTIATARHTDSCYEILENLGIRDRFSYILCGESTKNLKPHPEAVLKTLADLHFAPEEAMVIGDMPMDILMGKGAAAYACGVTYGNADRDTLLAAGADFVIDDIAALAGVIRGEA
jgi:stage III sporulation protein AE